MAVQIGAIEATLTADVGSFNKNLASAANSLDNLDSAADRHTKALFESIDATIEHAQAVQEDLAAVESMVVAEDAAIASSSQAARAASNQAREVSTLAYYLSNGANAQGLFSFAAMKAAEMGQAAAVVFRDMKDAAASGAGALGALGNAASGVAAKLKSLITPAVGLTVAIGVGIALFQRWRKHNEEVKKSVDDLTKALVGVTNAVNDNSVAWTTNLLVTKSGDATGRAYLELLNKTGISVEEFTRALSQGDAGMERFIQRLTESYQAGQLTRLEYYELASITGKLGDQFGASAADAKVQNDALAISAERAKEVGLALQGATAAYHRYADSVEPISTAVDNISFAMNDQRLAAEGSRSGLEDWAEAHTKAVTNFPAVVDAYRALVAGVAKARDDLRGEALGLIDTFGEVPEQITKSNAEILENIKVQSQMAAAFRANVTTLREQGLDYLADELEAAGPQAAQKAEDLVNDLETAMEMDDLLRVPVQDEIDAVEQTLIDAKQTLYDQALISGKQIPMGVSAGIGGSQNVAVTAIKTLANAMITAMKKELEIGSPSKVMGRIGKDMTRGLEDEVTFWTKTKAKSIAAKAAQTFPDGWKSSSGSAVAAVKDTMEEIQAVMDDAMADISSSISAGFAVFDAEIRVEDAQKKLDDLIAEAGGLPAAISAAQAKLDEEMAKSAKVTNAEQVAIERARSNLDRLRGIATGGGVDVVGTAIIDGIRQYVTKTSDLINATVGSAAEIALAEEQLQAAIDASTAATRDEDKARQELNGLLERQLTIGDDIVKADRDLLRAQWALVTSQERLARATDANTLSNIVKGLQSGGAGGASPGLIDFAFANLGLKGDANYWKNLPQNSAEWADFWAAVLGGSIGGGTQTFNITVDGAQDPAAVAQAIRKEFVLLSSQNGSVGF